jgi:hypothetical protein
VAITTYAELKTGLDNWLDHTLFQAREGEFIANFEAWANRRIRVRQQVTSTDLTPSSGTVTVPTDYLEWIRLTRLSDPVQTLEYLAPDTLQTLYPATLQATYPPGYPTFPEQFTIEGSSILLRPTDDTTDVRLVYYAKVPALSDSATQNWLLSAHPDFYLFGSLFESSLFGTNDARAATWKQRRDEILAEIVELYSSSIGVGARRAEGPTP